MALTCYLKRIWRCLFFGFESLRHVVKRRCIASNEDRSRRAERVKITYLAIYVKMQGALAVLLQSTPCWSRKFPSCLREGLGVGKFHLEFVRAKRPTSPLPHAGGGRLALTSISPLPAQL